MEPLKMPFCRVVSVASRRPLEARVGTVDDGSGQIECWTWTHEDSGNVGEPDLGRRRPLYSQDSFRVVESSFQDTLTRGGAAAWLPR